MPSEAAGGAQTTTIGTEHTLATLTTAGTYQLAADLSPMQVGDVVELRIKVKVRAASQSQQVFYASYADLQGQDVVALSPPVPAPFEFVATLKQVAGTSRSFEWSIYQY